MRTLSTSTTLVDPYRAGLALGLELAAIQPEVVFLFCTAHYAKWDELLEGLYDGLDDASVQLIGATGTVSGALPCGRPGGLRFGVE
ncbi:MAG: hypothetical protein IPN06_06335 [Burkholderiales bacterium]|nr:hypothetical protein [Burkholderiales bacterium]